MPFWPGGGELACLQLERSRAHCSRGGTRASVRFLSPLFGLGSLSRPGVAAAAAAAVEASQKSLAKQGTSSLD